MDNSLTITVFGGSGFLGSHVSDQLSEAGHKVCVFDCVESPWLRRDQKMILGDLLDEKKIMDAVEGCDAIYNFADLINKIAFGLVIWVAATANTIGSRR